MLRNRPRPRLLLAALALLGLALPATAGATARPRTKIVRYHGYKLVVPAAWPVYNLATAPTVCVRFNRHAVYLGSPNSSQRCPAHEVGRTEAILVAPVAAHGAGARGGSAGPVLPPVGSRNAQPPQGSSTELAVPSAGVLVTATWATDQAVVRHALGVRTFRASVASPAAHPATARPAGVHPAQDPAAPAGVAPAAPAAAAQAAAAEAHAAQALPRATHRGGDPLYTGLGFDACSTPSASTMSAWGTSPFRAVGIYVGGANEACAQPNLSPGWVQQESAAGWVLLPVYVGLQAPSNGCGCAAIVPGQAAAEGTAAADDAINQAAAVGITPGNPIYDDMENYHRGGTNTSAVLAYLAAWTTELHAHGYISGVYSSAGSGITDLVAQVGTGYLEPDEIWTAEWNGQANTISAYVPSTDWPNHQRLHQYQGGHNATYGGATINIDSDYVDAGGASGTVLFPNGTFVQVAGTTSFWEIAGNAPLLVNDWSAVGGQQLYTVITQQQFNMLSPVPADGTLFATDTGAVYVVAGGAPMYVSSTAVFTSAPQPFLVDQWNLDNVGNPVSHLRPYPATGTFLTATTGQSYRIAGGAPIAISNWSLFGGAQPSVTIDPWDIANTNNPLARLAARPTIGTAVEGLPSGAYWRFGPKNRYLIPPSPGVVRVDDSGLLPYSAMPCRVPSLAHKTLTQVKQALIVADCHLGKVHRHLLTRRRHTLRVIKQVPKARTKHTAYYTVGITLG